jgi:hypothetical protein
MTKSAHAGQLPALLASASPINELISRNRFERSIANLMAILALLEWSF